MAASKKRKTEKKEPKRAKIDAQLRAPSPSTKNSPVSRIVDSTEAVPGTGFILPWGGPVNKAK